MTAPQSLTLAALRDFGRTLVAAPHPDDEALGCGGLIALLRGIGLPVHAVLVSDGSRSHPNSRQVGAAALAALRAREWQQGLACLGVPPGHLRHLGLRDGQVPAPGAPGFDAAVQRVAQLLVALTPQTLLLPWRRDPHPDHRATHALFTHALTHLGATGTPAPRRCLEYAVWLDERAAPGDQPESGEVQAWQLDIGDALIAKEVATACHRSQLGGLITDDPQGFVLPAGLLERARRPIELYFESLSVSPTPCPEHP